MKIRARSVLKWTGITFAGLVTLAAAAVVYVVFFFDWNSLRSVAAKHGSAAAGRDFAIEGNLDVQPGWRVWRVHAEGIRLANAEWSQDPDMVRIDALDVSIEIWELLRGRIVLPELALLRPQVVIERLDEERKNWQFGKPDEEEKEEAAAPERTDLPVIGHLVIDGGRVVYRDAPTKLHLETKISMAVDSGGDKEEKLIQLEGNGTLQEQPLTLTIRAGSFLTLRDPGKPYPLMVDLQAGATRFFAEGKIDDPLQVKGFDATLEASGNNVADILAYAAIPLPPTPSYSIGGRVRNDGDQWWVEDFRSRLGRSDVTGYVHYDGSGERPKIVGDIASQRLNYDDIKSLIGEKDEEKERLLPDTPLKAELLRTADADVRFRARRINAPNNMVVENLEGRALLDEGQLTVDPLSLRFADGTLAGRLVLDGRDETAGVQAAITARGLSLKSLFTNKAAQDVFAGRLGGRLQLTGTGPTIADVLGSSNGRAIVTMSGGQISLLAMEAAGLDIAEAAARLIGKDRPADLRCVIADFRIESGVAASHHLVIDTSDTRVDGTANIDLKHERLEVRALAKPKDPSPFAVRTPVTVRGPMKDPQIRVDAAPLVGRGAAAIGLGAVFPPLAAIPFIEFGLGEDSDCHGLLQQTAEPGQAPREPQASPPPGAPPPSSQRPPANRAPANPQANPPPNERR